eukprot:363718-Chlamydomonas_euryale.AAC.5
MAAVLPATAPLTLLIKLAWDRQLWPDWLWPNRQLWWMLPSACPSTFAVCLVDADVNVPAGGGAGGRGGGAWAGAVPPAGAPAAAAHPRVCASAVRRDDACGRAAAARVSPLPARSSCCKRRQRRRRDQPGAPTSSSERRRHQQCIAALRPDFAPRRARAHALPRPSVSPAGDTRRACACARWQQQPPTANALPAAACECARARRSRQPPAAAAPAAADDDAAPAAAAAGLGRAGVWASRRGG